MWQILPNDRESLILFTIDTSFVHGNKSVSRSFNKETLS